MHHRLIPNDTSGTLHIFKCDTEYRLERYHSKLFLSLPQRAFGGLFLNRKMPANVCLQTVVPKAIWERQHRTPKQSFPTEQATEVVVCGTPGSKCLEENNIPVF